MSIELIAAIGAYIVMPICAAATLIAFIYFAMKP